MSIKTATTDQVYALTGTMGNTLRTILNYRSDSRNPAQVAAVDAAVIKLKTLLDAVAVP